MSSSSEQPSKSTNPQRKEPTRPDAVSPQRKAPASIGKRGKPSKQQAASDAILLHKPKRPKPPSPADVVAPKPKAVAQPTPPASETPEQPVSASPSLPEDPTASQQPIPPPSEPMQYRAIGLIQGQYLPSQDQFNRGVLMTEDGTALDAVLLGQVMSLVKKYLDLGRSYLWVVYPRTRDKQETLHIQIVGVWSDEGFTPVVMDSQVDTTDQISGVDEMQVVPQAGLAPPLKDGYFSIRGQVVFHSPEKKFVLVKIQQSPRKSSDRPRMFKLKLLGVLEGQPMGYFWDFHVQRDGNSLVIANAMSIAMVPLKKRKRKKINPSPRKPTSPVPTKAASSDVPAPLGASKNTQGVERPIKRNTRTLDSGK